MMSIHKLTAGDGYLYLIRQTAAHDAVAYRDHNLTNSLAWNSPIEETLRAQMRTTIARELFAEQYGRPPADERELTGFIATQSRDQTTSTAGYVLQHPPGGARDRVGGPGV